MVRTMVGDAARVFTSFAVSGSRCRLSSTMRVGCAANIAGQAHGQFRVVGDRGLDADQHRHVRQPQPVDFLRAPRR